MNVALDAITGVLVNKIADIQDTSKYPYCAFLITDNAIADFKIYRWDYVRKNKDLLRLFHEYDWEKIIDNYFHLLKNKIFRLMEYQIWFPTSIELLAVPSILIKDDLPKFPLSKCIFTLPLYVRYVLREDYILDRLIGHLHFNNGIFVYAKIHDDNGSEDEEEEDEDDDCECEN